MPLLNFLPVLLIVTWLLLNRRYRGDITNPIAYQLIYFLLKVLIPYAAYATLNDMYSTMFSYYALGILLLLITYSLVENRGFQHILLIKYPKEFISPWRPFVAFISFFSIGCYFYSSGYDHFTDGSAKGGIFNTFATISPYLFELSFVVYATYLLKKQTFYSNCTVVILLMLALLLGYFEGGRSRLVLPFFWLLIAYTSATTIRISLRTFCFIFSLFLLISILPLNLYKEYRLEQANQTYGSSGDYEYNFIQGLKHLSATAIHGHYIYENTPSRFDYHYGSTIGPDLLTGLIPRFLWQEKPVQNNGKYFSYLIYGGESNLERRNAWDGIGMFAELYLNFGPMGVLVIPLYGLVFVYFISRARRYEKLDSVEVRAVRRYFLLTVASTFLVGEPGAYFTSILRYMAYTTLFLIAVTGSFRITFLDRSD